MPNLMEDILNFKVAVYGGPDGKDGAEAIITIALKNSNVFFRFFNELKVVPKNTVVETGSGKKVYYINYKYAQLQTILHLLRTTKDLKFSFDSETKNGGLVVESEALGTFAAQGNLQRAV